MGAEARPRVAGAYAIFEATDLNPFRGILAAAAFRLPSRGHLDESSTSSEAQAPVECVDVEGGLQALDKLTAGENRQRSPPTSAL